MSSNVSLALLRRLHGEAAAEILAPNHAITPMSTSSASASTLGWAAAPHARSPAARSPMAPPRQFFSKPRTYFSPESSPFISLEDLVRRSRIDIDV
jgi:hypothetical protein